MKTIYSRLKLNLFDFSSTVDALMSHSLFTALRPVCLCKLMLASRLTLMPLLEHLSDSNYDTVPKYVIDFNIDQLAYSTGIMLCKTYVYLLPTGSYTFKAQTCTKTFVHMIGISGYSAVVDRMTTVHGYPLKRVLAVI
jgi:hypothetical protein